MCSRFRRRREQTIVVQVVAGSVRDQPVRRVRDQRDEWMAHRLQITTQQLARLLSGTLVERSEHDIELLENRIRKVEPPFRQDVHLAAVEDGHAGKSFTYGGNLLGLTFHRRY